MTLQPQQEEPQQPASQTRALERWEAQKSEWEQTGKRLAVKIGKDEANILHNTVHRWRERGEELEVLTASVPQESRSSDGWLMSLRNQGDGVRYVKFGTSYPYPLYCPIPSHDERPADSHTHMKVMTENEPSKKTLSSTSQYYKTREVQYKHNIARKFPQRGGKGDGMLVVEGQPAPRTTEAVGSTVSAAVQLYEYVKEEEEDDDGDGNNNNNNNIPAARSNSTDLSLSTADSNTPDAQGPLLLLAANNLSFSSSPLELSHRPLAIVNLGSTAIYYCWKPIPEEGLKNSKGDAVPMGRRPYSFILSETYSGVVLPGNEHVFSFAFRSLAPCVASERWELQTVPSGKEQIIVTLRATCVAKEHNPLAVSVFKEFFTRRGTREMVEGLLTGVLTKPGGENVLTKSDKAARLKLVKTAEDAALEKEREERENEKKFTEENGSTFTYTKGLYEEFASYWRGTSPWDGSLDTLWASLESLPPSPTKTTLQKAYDATLLASRAALTPPTHCHASFSRMLTSLVSDIPLVAAAFATPKVPQGKERTSAKSGGKKPTPQQQQQQQGAAAEDGMEARLHEHLMTVVKERLSAGVESAVGQYEATVRNVKEAGEVGRQ